MLFTRQGDIYRALRGRQAPGPLMAAFSLSPPHLLSHPPFPPPPPSLPVSIGLAGLSFPPQGVAVEEQ